MRADSLQDLSAQAFGEGTRILIRAGVTGFKKQVEVQALPPHIRDDVVVMAFTWHATGPFGEFFPVLDANLELAGSGGPDDGTTITLIGSYRVPAGRVGKALDRVLLHDVAEATVRRFLDDLVARAATVTLETDSTVNGAA